MRLRPLFPSSLSLRVFSAVFSAVLIPAAQAQLSVAVGTTSAIQTATVVVTTAGTSDSATPIYVLTQGAQNSDFKLVSGGTCAATTPYALSATCTVNYTFTPSHPGLRSGGITLVATAGVVLGNTFISGTGLGSQAIYNPVVQSTFSTGTQPEKGIAVSGNGDIYIMDSSSGGGNPLLRKIPAGCGDYTCIVNLSSAFSSNSCCDTSGLAVDGSGNLYIAEEGSQGQSVHEMLAVGGVIQPNATVINLGSSVYYNPSHVWPDANGNVYIASYSGIQKLAAVNGVIPSNATPITLAAGNDYTAMAVDVSGNVYFSTAYTDSIGRIDATTGTITQLGGENEQEAAGMAFDSSGNLYVADQEYTSVQEYLAVNGVLPANPTVVSLGNFQGFTDLAVDASGNVYVAVYSAYAFYVLNYSSVPTLTFATPTQDGSTDTADGPQSFQITNVGNAALTATAPGFGGLTTGYFFQVPGSGTPADCTSTFSLAVGASCNVSISFKPVIPAGQAITDTFQLIDNNLSGGSTGTQTINLNATAVPPQPSVTGLSVTTGPSAGGTPVTITGVNLTGTSAVKFGTASATSVAVISSTQVSAISPAYTGGSTVDVTVISYGATSATSAADHFIYALTPDTITVPGTLPTSVIFNSGTVSIGATSTSGQQVTYTSTTTPVCSVNASGVITFLSIGTCTVNVSQPAAGSYAAATTVPVTIQVTVATDTITFPALTDTAYGSTPPVPSATSTSAQPVTYASATTSVCTSTSNGVISFVAIGTCTITANQSAAGNYAAATQMQQSFTVLPEADTITITGTIPASMYLGTGTISIGATSTSAQPVTYASTTPAVCSVTTPGGVITLLSAGLCTVNVSQAAAGNFAAATTVPVSVTAVLDVDTITIPGTVPTSVYLGSGTISIGATSTSGQPVTYVSTTPGVCSVTSPDGIVTLLSAGVCTVSVSQAAAGFYAAAPTVQASITVSLVPNSITFPALPNVAYGATPVAAAVATSGQPVTYTSNTATTCTVVSNGTITILGTGVCTITASQNAVGNYAAAASVSQSFMITSGSLPVGTSSGTVSVPVTITTAGTLNTINVTTQGATGLDFNIYTPAVPPSGACATGTSYTVGQICTVQYTFKPTQPFQRFGGVALSDASGNLLGNSFLLGTGTAPHVIYNNVVASTLGSGFANPAAIAVDASGNVFVADSNANTIKELVAVNGVVPASPNIRTLGSGFLNPGGVAVDGNGNVYVADSTNGAVKELIAVNGVVPLSPAILTLGIPLGSPTGIAVDGSGNVYVGATGNNAVMEIPPGCFSAACVLNLGTVHEPQGIAVDNSGNVYVAVIGSTTIQKLVAVNGAVPPGSTPVAVGSGFSYIYGVAVDGLGNVYVTDTGNGSIKEVLASNNSVITLGSGYNYPQAVAVDVTGNIYIAATNAAGINELSYTSAPSFNFATPTLDGATDTTDGRQTFQIINNGNATLTAVSPGIGGLVTHDFSYVQGPGNPPDCDGSMSLTPGSSCSVSIEFTPAPGAVGAVTDTVTVIDNNLNASPSATQSVSLSGIAIAPVPVVTAISPAFGPVTGGTVVTITGSGFLNATTVQFGTVVATTFTVVSNTSITAVYPGGTSGAVDVTVTTPGGTSATSSADLFTATAPTGYNAGTEPVGTQSAPLTAYLTITTAGTLNAISVVTQGAAGLDFKSATGGSPSSGACSTSVAYTVGQVCSVQYTFNPLHPWTRAGGILLMDASGKVLGSTYLSGTGTGPQVSYNYSALAPTSLGGGISNGVGLAVDGTGNVYVTEQGSNVVQEIPVGCLTGSCVLTLGSGFLNPQGLAVDGLGNVYVADISNGAVKELVAVNGVVPANPAHATILTRYTNHTFGPQGITVDANGNLFFTDVVNSQLDELPAGGTFRVLASGFSGPQGVAVDGNGNIFVANISSGVIDEIAGGTGTPTPVGTGFSEPAALTVDGAGNVYVIDYTIPGIREMIAVNGSLPASPAMTTLGGATIEAATAVAVDAAGDFYLTDYSAAGVQELSRASAPAITFATPTVAGTTDTADGYQSFQVVNSGNAAVIATTPGPASLATGDFSHVAGTGTPPDCAASFTLAAGASCNVSVSFAPVPSATGLVTDALTVVSNTLNASPSVTQTATITGSATVAGAPQILFVSPTEGPLAGGTTVTIYGSGFTGVTAVNFGGVPATNVQFYADNAVTAVAPAQSAGVVDVTVTTPLGTSPVSASDEFTYSFAAISWNPSTTTVYFGNPLGNGILDATDAAAGTITYETIPLLGGSASPATAATVLQPGAYIVEANFTPSSNTYNSSFAYIEIQVNLNNVFIVGSNGMAQLDNAGGVITPATSGGGIGAAVDSNGYVWSIDTSGASISKFASAGTLSASYSGVGLSGATALAIDGSGQVWVTNSNNTVSVLSNAGTVVSTTSDPSISGPSGIAVDISGNVWISNSSTSTVDEILGGAAPSVTLAAGVQSTPGVKP